MLFLPQLGTEIFLSVSATNNPSRFFPPFKFCLHTILLRFNAISTHSLSLSPSTKSTFDLETIQLPLGHGIGLLVPLPVHESIIYAKPIAGLMQSSLSIFPFRPQLDDAHYEVTLEFDDDGPVSRRLSLIHI